MVTLSSSLYLNVLVIHNNLPTDELCVFSLIFSNSFSTNYHLTFGKLLTELNQALKLSPASVIFITKFAQKNSLKGLIN